MHVQTLTAVLGFLVVPDRDFFWFTDTTCGLQGLHGGGNVRALLYAA
jgi:hypothetical protein